MSDGCAANNSGETFGPESFNLESFDLELTTEGLMADGLLTVCHLFSAFDSTELVAG